MPSHYGLDAPASALESISGLIERSSERFLREKESERSRIAEEHKLRALEQETIARKSALEFERDKFDLQSKMDLAKAQSAKTLAEAGIARDVERTGISKRQLTLRERESIAEEKRREPINFTQFFSDMALKDLSVQQMIASGEITEEEAKQAYPIYHATEIAGVHPNVYTGTYGERGKITDKLLKDLGNYPQTQNRYNAEMTLKAMKNKNVIELQDKFSEKLMDFNLENYKTGVEALMEMIPAEQQGSVEIGINLYEIRDDFIDDKEVKIPVPIRTGMNPAEANRVIAEMKAGRVTDEAGNVTKPKDAKNYKVDFTVRPRQVQVTEPTGAPAKNFMQFFKSGGADAEEYDEIFNRRTATERFGPFVQEEAAIGTPSSIDNKIFGLTDHLSKLGYERGVDYTAVEMQKLLDGTMTFEQFYRTHPVPELPQTSGQRFLETGLPGVARGAIEREKELKRISDEQAAANLLQLKGLGKDIKTIGGALFPSQKK